MSSGARTPVEAMRGDFCVSGVGSTTLLGSAATSRSESRQSAQGRPGRRRPRCATTRRRLSIAVARICCCSIARGGRLRAACCVLACSLRRVQLPVCQYPVAVTASASGSVRDLGTCTSSRPQSSCKLQARRHSAPECAPAPNHRRAEQLSAALHALRVILTIR